MLNINLLPWRREQHERDKKLMSVGAGVSVAVAAVITLIVHFIFGTSINEQKHYNRVLQSEISAVTAQLNTLQNTRKDNNALKARLTDFSALQHNRRRNIETLNVLTKIIPKGMYLSYIKNDSKKITIKGQANSNLLISRLLTYIKNSKEVTGATLHEATQHSETTAGPGVIRFIINADLKQYGANIKANSKGLKK